VFLFCGQGQDTSFIVPEDGESEPRIPRPDSARVAQVTVDTSDMDKPVIAIEFSSIINFLGLDDDAKGSISFLLFRACNNEEPRVVNSWPYEVFELEEDNTDMRLSTSFVFNYCECLNCPGCCQYFVEVFAGGLSEANIVINNVNIAALVAESDYAKCRPKGSVAKPPLLFCGQGGNGAFVNPDDPSPIVGKVLVDARDVCKPMVSIEYSSIVSFLATNDGLSDVNDDDGAQGRLRFSLFRVCHNKPPKLINNWIYEVFQIEDSNESIRFIDSFSFNFCDVLPCPECCEYIVEVSIENLLTANIDVNNVHMTALVQ